MTKKNDYLIIALDFPDLTSSLRLIDQLENEVSFYKVGMQSFFGFGDQLIRELHLRKKDIFLDLKLHDIPNTMSGALESLAKYKPKFLTLFCGRDGVEAVINTRNNLQLSTKIFNVTVLTSEPDGKVKDRVVFSYEAGADGVICSGLETQDVKSVTSKDFLVINPSIRLQNITGKEDQKRIVTPNRAKLAGADYIVVGRPVTEAENPKVVVQKICQNWELGD